jgi:MFS family permease
MSLGRPLPPPPPQRLSREILVLVGSGFLVALGYGIVVPALPLFARSFHVGVTAPSAVVSAFAVVRIAFAPVSGRLVGRLGELRVFCAGLVVVALSSAACAAATDYLQLLVFRAVGGIGSTMFTLSAASLVLRFAPAGLYGRATGAWATGFLLGTVAGRCSAVDLPSSACGLRSSCTPGCSSWRPSSRPCPCGVATARGLGSRSLSP